MSRLSESDYCMNKCFQALALRNKFASWDGCDLEMFMLWNDELKLWDDNLTLCLPKWAKETFNDLMTKKRGQ